MKDFKKTFVWMLVFVALIVLTIYVMASQSKSFSFDNLLETIGGMNPATIILAFLGMLGFIFFEGYALVIILRVFGYKRQVRKSWLYAAPDVYFSAITPSATGGQPASAFFMHNDKIPAAVSTIALILNLTFYTASIIVVGIICWLINPTILGNFKPGSILLITVGFFVQLGLCILFILLMYKEQIIKKITAFIIKVLTKLHVVKRAEKYFKKLDKMEVQYRQCASLILQNKKELSKAFLCNILQRVSQILVSVFVFIGVTGGFKDALNSFATQGYVAIGSNAVPIPGAVGAADWLYIDGFENLLGKNVEHKLVSMELVSRGISFYVCVLACGIFTFTAYILHNIRKKKKEG